MSHPPKTKTLQCQTILKNLILLVTLILLISFFAIGIQLYSAYRDFTNPKEGLPQQIENGKDYYVFVQRLEVTGEDIEGKPCDEGDLPDLYYIFKWRGLESYKSDIRKNTLTTYWQGCGLNYGEQLKEMALNLHTVMDASFLTPGEDNNFEIDIFDADQLRSDDKIATVRDSLDHLKTGKNIIPCNNLKNVKSLEIFILPIEQAPSYVGQRLKEVLWANKGNLEDN